MNIKLIKKLKVFLLCCSVFILLSSSAFAQLYGESVDLNDLSDSRDITVLGGDWVGFDISWNIAETSLGSGLWDYSYTLSNSKDVSNFILEITQLGEFDNLTNVMIEDSPGVLGTNYYGPQTWTKSGNVDLPPTTSIYGYKFEDGVNPFTISFTTNRDPVWGDFFAKDGKDDGNDVVAYNLGLTNHSSTNTNDFIVRPNGGANPPVVPEPVSSTLFLVGAATLGFRRLRRNRKG